MTEILEAFNKMTKSQTYTEMASISGISRNTIYNVRHNPEGTTLRTLRRIVGAMGYRLVIKLEEIPPNCNEVDSTHFKPQPDSSPFHPA